MKHGKRKLDASQYTQRIESLVDDCNYCATHTSFTVNMCQYTDADQFNQPKPSAMTGILTDSTSAMNTKKKRNTDTKGTIVDQIDDRDVYCGKDRRTRAHPGNKLFHALIKKHHQRYQKAKLREEKTRLTTHIINTIHETGVDSSSAMRKRVTGSKLHPIKHMKRFHMPSDRPNQIRVLPKRNNATALQHLRLSKRIFSKLSWLNKRGCSISLSEKAGQVEEDKRQQKPACRVVVSTR